MRIASSTMFENELDSLNDQFQRFSDLEWMSTYGSKLIRSSDDPVLASRVKITDDLIADLDSYTQNSIVAGNRTTVYEKNMDQCVGTMTNIRDLIINAQSDTLTDKDRSALGDELQGFLDFLLDTANFKDGSNYIYAGSSTRTKPYIEQNGSYSYVGDDSTQSINISANSSIPYLESGFQVFGNIANGNGVFQITGNTSNTGTAVVYPGTKTGFTDYVRDDYTLTFVQNSAGELAYQMVGANEGQVIPPPPANIPADAPAYEEGVGVNVNGMSMTITGTPSVGDSFSVTPSDKENIFNMVSNLISLLKTPVTDAANRAQYHQKLSQLSASIEQAQTHFIEHESQVGTRGAFLKTQNDLADSLRSQQNNIRDKLVTAEPAEVISEIQQAMMTINMTTQIYSQIQSVLSGIFKNL